MKTIMRNPKTPASAFAIMKTNAKNNSDTADEFEGTVLLNTKYNCISIIGTISEERLVEFQNCLWKLQQSHPKRITCLLNGSGGALSPGMAMHDLIKISPVPITTIGEGDISSATLYIFLAGAKRLLMPHSLIRFHHAVGESTDGDEKEAEKTLNRWRMHNQRIKEVVKENSTTLSDKTIDKYLEDFTTLSPIEAIQCGLAHDIIRRFPVNFAKSKRKK